MFQEKRPTCVTVIGWTWIILGGLMFFSSIMALFSFSMISQTSQANSQSHQDIPAIFKYFPLLAIVQIGVSVTGLVSGINFLKLKSWSRSVLEILTWLLLLFVVGFGGFFIFQWSSMSSPHTSFGFSIMEFVMAIGIFGIYGIPLGIMVKYLRGEKVKKAIIDSAEPHYASDRSSRRYG
ncbi:MAG: hypothetical protein SVW57_15545 [Thermodesulfobacteriota bacterium]|nr:hypothetical protein [Thermodesulfobacteriota bacterium]